MLERNNSQFIKRNYHYCLVSQGHAHPIHHPTHPQITLTLTLDCKDITPITCTQLVLTQASLLGL